MPTKRSLITGLVCLIAAPAIVRATSLMPVKPVRWWEPEYWVEGYDVYGNWVEMPFVEWVKDSDVFDADRLFERNKNVWIKRPNRDIWIRGTIKNSKIECEYFAKPPDKNSKN